MSKFTVCKMDGFGVNLSVTIHKGENWETDKECCVYLHDSLRSILLGKFPIDEAFDFTETFATAFGIWQYDMSIDNKETENNG